MLGCFGPLVGWKAARLVNTGILPCSTHFVSFRTVLTDSLQSFPSLTSSKWMCEQEQKWVHKKDIQARATECRSSMMGLQQCHLFEISSCVESCENYLDKQVSLQLLITLMSRSRFVEISKLVLFRYANLFTPGLLTVRCMSVKPTSHNRHS